MCGLPEDKELFAFDDSPQHSLGKFVLLCVHPVRGIKQESHWNADVIDHQPVSKLEFGGSQSFSCPWHPHIATPPAHHNTSHTILYLQSVATPTSRPPGPTFYGHINVLYAKHARIEDDRHSFPRLGAAQSRTRLLALESPFPSAE